MKATHRRLALAAVIALAVALLAGGAPGAAQSSPEAGSPVAGTPVAPLIDVPLVDADGQQVGSVEVAQNEAGVTFTVFLTPGALAEGDHGMHVHEIGTCEQGGDEPFALAGDHFNPTDQQHGPPNTDTSHAGDLGNLPVAAGGGSFAVTTVTLTLAADQANSLMDDDGSALLIHADADDLLTDPSGNSGDRVLCAVIAGGMTASPVASPVG